MPTFPAVVYLTGIEPVPTLTSLDSPGHARHEHLQARIVCLSRLSQVQWPSFGGLLTALVRHWTRHGTFTRFSCTASALIYKLVRGIHDIPRQEYIV
jgi:hypothetical protein